MRQASRESNKDGVPGSTTYLVEHYWPGITVEGFRAAAERGKLDRRQPAPHRVVPYFLA